MEMWFFIRATKNLKEDTYTFFYRGIELCDYHTCWNLYGNIIYCYFHEKKYIYTYYFFEWICTPLGTSRPANCTCVQACNRREHVTKGPAISPRETWSPLRCFLRYLGRAKGSSPRGVASLRPAAKNEQRTPKVVPHRLANDANTCL